MQPESEMLEIRRRNDGATVRLKGKLFELTEPFLAAQKVTRQNAIAVDIGKSSDYSATNVSAAELTASLGRSSPPTTNCRASAHQ
jgi:hypothetical protein